MATICFAEARCGPIDTFSPSCISQLTIETRPTCIPLPVAPSASTPAGRVHCTMDDGSSRFRDRELVPPGPAEPVERPQGPPPGAAAAAATPLLPPGIGLPAAAAGGSPLARKR